MKQIMIVDEDRYYAQLLQHIIQTQTDFVVNCQRRIDQNQLNQNGVDLLIMDDAMLNDLDKQKYHCSMPVLLLSIYKLLDKKDKQPNLRIVKNMFKYEVIDRQRRQLLRFLDEMAKN